MVDLAAVMAEHNSNVGWREGANNDNKWGAEQGVGNYYAYCDSGCSMVPYHHGLRWWPECTFHDKGCAYTVAHVNAARAHGKYIEDHASKGKPAPLAIGQPVFFDWDGSGGVDHVETVSELPQGALGNTFVTIGYNTGNPEGCWRVVRDRKYLDGTILMDEFYSGATAAQPPVAAPLPSPSNLQADRIKQLQGLVGAKVDGEWGPNTASACGHHMVCATQYHSSVHVGKGGVTNQAELVKFIQNNANRRFGSKADVDGKVGPQVNHIIVVNLGQSDGICGPNGFKILVQ